MPLVGFSAACEARFSTYHENHVSSPWNTRNAPFCPWPWLPNLIGIIMVSSMIQNFPQQKTWHHIIFGILVHPPPLLSLNKALLGSCFLGIAWHWGWGPLRFPWHQRHLWGQALCPISIGLRCLDRSAGALDVWFVTKPYATLKVVVDPAFCQHVGLPIWMMINPYVLKNGETHKY